jgi:hypothetical protein
VRLQETNRVALCECHVTQHVGSQSKTVLINTTKIKNIENNKRLIKINRCNACKGEIVILMLKTRLILPALCAFRQPFKG